LIESTGRSVDPACPNPPTGRFDILEARAWYDAQQAGRGALFYAAVARVVGNIAEMPQAFPRVDGDTRRAVVRGYPYSVYFQLREDHILVMAIVHNSRNPNRWRSRI
jgi:plasmid stabilization system protein ParE